MSEPKSYLAIDAIREVHLELTSHCNASCPQCARIRNGKRNPDLPLGELSIEEIGRFLPPDFCRRLDFVYLCGNYGDPAASETTLPALRYFKNCGVRKLAIHSNGGLRSPAWWAELAQVLDRPRDRAIFGIDGLEDTNAIYRKGTDWRRIMENARSFIAAGGKARWDYLLFEHNAHQLEQARRLADEMGFAELKVKNTARNICGETGRFLSDLYPVKPAAANPTAEMTREIFTRFGRYPSFLNETGIECRTRRERSVYISFEGELWPCCWTASRKYLLKTSPHTQGVLDLYERYGADFNSLRVRSMEEILNHPWLNEKLTESWGLGIDDAQNPRLTICAKSCPKAGMNRV